MFTKFVLLSLLVTLLPCAIAQSAQMVFFPDDRGGLVNNVADVNIPENLNLTEIRGTTVYEKFVDKIIASGIAKLTLAINKALFQQVASDGENVVFAPVSIAGALALILLGSNGKTFQELTSVLGLTTGIDIESKSLQVHEQFGRILNKLERSTGLLADQQVNFAAAVFVQDDFPIRSLYVKTAQDLYESEVVNVDFKRNPSKAKEEINSWVAQSTNGKIRDILGEEPPSETKVIIASAMYFKALWQTPFFEGTTNRRPFYTNGRKSPTNIEVDLMANGGEFPYFKDPTLNCEVMGFPYQGNGSVMYVVIPSNSNARRLREFEESLTATDLERLADSTVYTEATLVFPKMRIETTIDLKKSLELLGVKTLFVPSQANLALLSPGEGLPKPIPPVPVRVPLTVNENSGSILLNRFGDSTDSNKTENVTTTPSLSNNSVFTSNNSQPNVIYKRFGDKIGRRIVGRSSETIDNLRHIINQQSSDNSYQNPGLYADKVIHKVFMDITESGTEAAASTSVSLSKSGGRVSFRVDVPFFFFIRNEETKTILFWGSVSVPTPNYKV